MNAWTGEKTQAAPGTSDHPGQPSEKYAFSGSNVPARGDIIAIRSDVPPPMQPFPWVPSVVDDWRAEREDTCIRESLRRSLRGLWSWKCTCGARSFGHATREAALQSWGRHAGAPSRVDYEDAARALSNLMHGEEQP